MCKQCFFAKIEQFSHEQASDCNLIVFYACFSNVDLIICKLLFHHLQTCQYFFTKIILFLLITCSCYYQLPNSIPSFRLRRHMIIVFTAFTVAVTSRSANPSVFEAFALVCSAFTFTLALKMPCPPTNDSHRLAVLGAIVHFLPILVGIL